MAYVPRPVSANKRRQAREVERIVKPHTTPHTTVGNLPVHLTPSQDYEDVDESEGEGEGEGVGEDVDEDEASQGPTQPYDTPPGTPVQPGNDDFGMAPVDTHVAAAAQPQVSVVPSNSINLDEFILGKIRDTYTEIKFNNFKIICDSSLDQLERLVDLLDLEFPVRGGKKHNFKNNSNNVNYKQNKIRKKYHRGGAKYTIARGDYLSPVNMASIADPVTQGSTKKNYVINNDNLQKLISTLKTLTDTAEIEECKKKIKNLVINLFTILVIADNDKDFNKRDELDILIDYLNVTADLKKDYHINLDKEALYYEVLKKIDDNKGEYGSMAVYEDALQQMMDGNQVFHPSGFTIVDVKPVGVGSTFDVYSQSKFLPHIFDSAGNNKILDLNTTENFSVDDQKNLMNQGLICLMNKYAILKDNFASISIVDVRDIGTSHSVFKMKFLWNNGSFFEIDNIRSGNGGVFTVSAIQEAIMDGTYSPEINTLFEEIKKVVTDVDDQIKLLHATLLCCKEGGDFEKIYFGFKAGDDVSTFTGGTLASNGAAAGPAAGAAAGAAAVSNFLATQDIMIFVVTMFLNFYYKYAIEDFKITKQTYILLGTKAKKIAFVDDITYYLGNKIRDLVETKINEKYKCYWDNDTLYVYVKEIVNSDGTSGCSLVSVNEDIVAVGAVAIAIFRKSSALNYNYSIDTATLDEFKKEYVTIMTAFEDASNLLNTLGDIEKIETFRSDVKTKIEKIINFFPTTLQRIVGADNIIESRWKFVLDSCTILCDILSNLLEDIQNFICKDFTLVKQTITGLNTPPGNPIIDILESNLLKIQKALLLILTDEMQDGKVKTPSLLKLFSNLPDFIDPLIKKCDDETLFGSFKTKSPTKIVAIQTALANYRTAYSKLLGDPTYRLNEIIVAINANDLSSASGNGAAGMGGSSIKKYSISKNKKSVLPIKIIKNKDFKDVKIGKSAKTVKDVKDVKDIKVGKSGKTVKDVKDVKDVKVGKSSKTIKEVKVSKGKTVKSNKTVKDVKPVKTVKDVKEVKVSKDKTVKSNKVVKDVKPAKATKTVKDIKEVKDKAEKKVKIGKEKITKNILGKDRRVYKITGDRKEYLKYKNELITVKEYIKRVKSNTKTNNKKIKENKKK